MSYRHYASSSPATGGFISLFGIAVMLAGLPNSTDLDRGFCEGAAKRREPVINS